jgi:hypothetical protein
MIPADHFLDNGDGTAWIATHGGLGIDLFDSFDRPCDTCDGLKVIELRPYGRGNERRCPDCDGTGRHTFTVEVEWVDGQRTPPQRFRVSVVPGMVLPIVDQYDETYDGMPSLECRDEGDIFWLYDQAYCDAPMNSDVEPIEVTLPPAAAPGMWAVLAVQS